MTTAGSRRAVVAEPGQGQQVRGLYVIAGESTHRVPQPPGQIDLARRLASGTDSLSRMRGIPSAP